MQFTTPRFINGCDFAWASCSCLGTALKRPQVVGQWRKIRVRWHITTRRPLRCNFCHYPAMPFEPLPHFVVQHRITRRTGGRFERLSTFPIFPIAARTAATVHRSFQCLERSLRAIKTMDVRCRFIAQTDLASSGVDNPGVLFMRTILWCRRNLISPWHIACT